MKRCPCAGDDPMNSPRSPCFPDLDELGEICLCMDIREAYDWPA